MDGEQWEWTRGDNGNGVRGKEEGERERRRNRERERPGEQGQTAKRKRKSETEKKRASMWRRRMEDGRRNSLNWTARGRLDYLLLYRSGNNGIPIMKWISLGSQWTSMHPSRDPTPSDAPVSYRSPTPPPRSSFVPSRAHSPVRASRRIAIQFFKLEKWSLVNALYNNNYTHVCVYRKNCD